MNIKTRGGGTKSREVKREGNVERKEGGER